MEPQAHPTTAAPSIALPAPRTLGALSLERALFQRRSMRELGPRSLTLDELGQLCWAAQGVSGLDGERTAPSAGALYPLELLIALPDAVHRYRPATHRLERHTGGDRRARLGAAAHHQSFVEHAPAVFVIAAIFSTTAARYGDRGARFVLLEAGHAAQNLLLEATALGLGGVPVGAFDDGAVHDALDLVRVVAPIYLLPVGAPA
jgi:SagB-type dehydrogenase family enzyme